ncbi:MAG: hypothetical protein SFW67_31215 [Myxococcaceae bacterium]|nr:hypothetical protein [Myxococcaceae bacterium]
MASGDEAVPYWVLVSVLTSSVPLDQGLALALHRVALELYRTGSSVGHLDHALAHGQVKNLRREALLGTVGGPVFEAELETERGAGFVRFLLTRQGLELLDAQRDASRRVPELLN